MSFIFVQIIVGKGMLCSNIRRSKEKVINDADFSAASYLVVHFIYA